MAYLERVHEFRVLNHAVFICVEVVVNDTHFLGGQKDTKFVQHFPKFELVQDAVRIGIKCLKNKEMEGLVRYIYIFECLRSEFKSKGLKGKVTLKTAAH